MVIAQSATQLPVQNASVLTPGNTFTQPWYIFFQQLFDRSGGVAGGGTVISGSLVDFAGSAVPDGYLLCDGSAVSRATYARLFAAIGVIWGPGDGTTTFNLPNFEGRFLLGANGSTLNVGDTGGSATHTLSTGELPAHSHAVTDPGHTHGVTDPGHHHTALVASSTNTAGAAAGTGVAGPTSTDTTGLTVNSATTGVTTQNTGGGTPFAIMPPYAVVLKVIKI